MFFSLFSSGVLLLFGGRLLVFLLSWGCCVSSGCLVSLSLLGSRCGFVQRRRWRGRSTFLVGLAATALLRRSA